MTNFLSSDFDKQFAELPLEQASRLLEDDAFENFPDDAFNDIFCESSAIFCTRRCAALVA